MFDLDHPIPNADRLGPTYRGWMCPKHGIVPDGEVTDMEDGTVWHSGWPDCGEDVEAVEMLVRDPRAWANEASAKMDVLAHEVLRLRKALAAIAENQGTPATYRRMARDTLRLGFIASIAEGGPSSDG